MRHLAESDRGQAIWHAAVGLGEDPATVLYAFRGGEPWAVFAVAAAAEAWERDNGRWETLMESLADLFDAYLGG